MREEGNFSAETLDKLTTDIEKLSEVHKQMLPDIGKEKAAEYPRRDR